MKIFLIVFGGVIMYFILGRYLFELWLNGTGTWSTERQNWKPGILMWSLVLISIPWIATTEIMSKIIKRL